ncbi:hypothetical protein OS493_006132 [Desmophyllum pertusum]|uniref:non-specific serine/threonine protein kinase n=1 Tax=Desmophyllum pertusum TaxID=174260 RepID=A0A9X0A4A9_9CNID|nr:hypothetical protein OS493_006132 [Desmophyllum pertusum]
MRTVKCVLVGDDNVDKRELFIKYVALLNAEAETATDTAEEDASTANHSQAGELTDVFVNGDVPHDEIEDGPDRHPNFRVIHCNSEKGSVSSVDSHQDAIDQWSGAVTVGGKQFFLDLCDARCQEAFDNIRTEVYSDADVFLVCFSVVRSISWENALNKWIPEIQLHCPVTPFILVGTQTEWRELWDEKDASKKPVFSVTGTCYAQQVGAVKYLEFATGDNEVREIFNAAVLVSVMDRMDLSTCHPDFEKEGLTLLHRAAKLDHIPSLEALVDFIDVNARDKELHTALDVAVKENNLNAIRFLLESGCELPNPPDPWKKCCEFWVSDDWEDSERVVNSDLTEFTRQLTFFYTTSSPRPLGRILLIGQNGTDVAKFVNETVPMLPITSLTIVNSEGPALFDFSRVQSCLESLTVTNCDFGSPELPGTLYSVASIKSLCVVKSGVSRLSEQLGELKSLQRLRLSGNKIRKLPDTISRLQKLKFAHCDRNALDNLPDTLGCLGSLESLDLTHNKLEKLSASLGLLSKLRNLWFAKNRLKFPPAHILNKGTESILEFLSDFLDDPVANNQIKMTVVGGSQVGKSSLVKALNHSKDWRINGVGPTTKTEGVEISSMNLMRSKLKVFDLGGDEAFFSSHHLFLSENTLYQVVFDMSAYTISKSSLSIYQLGRVELWLQVIFARAPNSHVLLVGTHADDPRLTDEIRTRIREDIETLLSKYRREHRRQFEGEAVPQCGLCEGTLICEGSSTGSLFYVQEQMVPHVPGPVPEPCIPHVVGYYEVSCQGQFPKHFLSSKNRSLQKFKVGLGSSAYILLSTKVSSRIPQKCLYVRDRIHEMCHAENELQNWPLLTYDRLREIANGCGVKQDFKLKALMTYFHSQGEILWYEDMPDIGDVIFIDPSWLSKQICLLVGSRSGASSGLDGILRIDNLAKTWPDVPEGQRFSMLTLFRNLGLCFPLSDTEDLVPFQLPIGRADKDTWPTQPSEDERQISCEFHFSFLPPTFFSDLTITINRRRLPNSIEVEPTFYRFYMVFATTSIASMGCPLHCKDMSAHPLADNLDVHRVSIEGVPFENKLKVIIRGESPCCVLPDVRAAIKMVVDTRYPGVRYIRRIVCPVCELTAFKSPALLSDLVKDGNNCCSWGHVLGTEAEIIAGDLPVVQAPPKLPTKGAVRMGVFFGEAGQILDDCYCPRLPVVLPIGFQSAPFKKRLRVNSPIKDGYSVHFLCECPGYWHLPEGPGFRVPDIRAFLEVFGTRACKLLKLAFMLREDDTQDGPSESRVPVKIMLGDAKLRDVLVTDIQDLLEHYFVEFPELKNSYTGFMQDDLDFVQSYEALSRSKMCKLLEISPDWWRLGSLVCTYNSRTNEHFWLCEKHALL